VWSRMDRGSHLIIEDVSQDLDSRKVLVIMLVGNKKREGGEGVEFWSSGGYPGKRST
jgi:hypothetical protein